MLSMTPDSSARFLRALSRFLGWIYTCSWSLSFYPQPLLNFRRKSVEGMGIDFPILNVFGFTCYTASTSALLYSPVIRNQYAARHPVSFEPTVRFNDLVFGVHAVVLTALTYSQFFPMIWGFEVSKAHRIARPIAGVFWGSIVAVLLVIMIVLVKGRDGHYAPLDWAWIDVIYSLGYIKVLVTFIKYQPQVILNWRNQSTEGWSIGQILFDLTGGIFSLLQLIIDSSQQGDWSGLTGNPTKLGLAVVSMCFDLIFITQHFVLYRKSTKSGHNVLKDDADDSEEPLLSD